MICNNLWFVFSPSLKKSWPFLHDSCMKLFPKISSKQKCLSEIGVCILIHSLIKVFIDKQSSQVVWSTQMEKNWNEWLVSERKSPKMGDFLLLYIETKILVVLHHFCTCTYIVWMEWSNLMTYRKSSIYPPTLD